jgi:DNA (cytosine-5)-methyltransferase 1
VQPSNDYVTAINSVLGRPTPTGPLVLDLFAGCGGLSLGFEAQGFRTIGYEMEPDCCATYNSSLAGECVSGRLTVNSQFPQASVVIGGPPCQPFSVGGDQRGRQDERDGLPTFVAAVASVRPELFLFENVRGVFYKNRQYFEHFLDQLRGLGYLVDARLLNAVDYGVPQNRERVIVVGHHGGFRFPAKARRRTTAGDAIGDLAGLIPAESRFLTPSMDAYVLRYEIASKCINPRDLDMSRPARTLTCRNLAGATGDMQRVKLPDGRRRRLLIREAARLQSFPDWFKFSGGETSQFNQIGNAVPPLFAYQLASSVASYLRAGPTTEAEASDTMAHQVALPIG